MGLKDRSRLPEEGILRSAVPGKVFASVLIDPGQADAQDVGQSDHVCEIDPGLAGQQAIEPLVVHAGGDCYCVEVAPVDVHSGFRRVSNHPITD